MLVSSLQNIGYTPRCDAVSDDMPANWSVLKQLHMGEGLAEVMCRCQAQLIAL